MNDYLAYSITVPFIILAVYVAIASFLLSLVLNKERKQEFDKYLLVNRIYFYLFKIFFIAYSFGIVIDVILIRSLVYGYISPLERLLFFAAIILLCLNIGLYIGLFVPFIFWDVFYSYKKFKRILELRQKIEETEEDISKTKKSMEYNMFLAFSKNFKDIITKLEKIERNTRQSNKIKK